METDIRPIDDANLMPAPQQHQMRNTRGHQHHIEEEEDDDESIRQTPIYLPPPPQQPYHFDKKTQDLFGEIDKTTYIIIFVAFILGFFMGKTMQPVILRPT
jgi:hypothetical protein